MKLTVDTNVLRDAVDPHRPGHATALQLLALHDAGECEIAVTTRLDVDVPRDPLRSTIESLPLVQDGPVGSLFRLDYSRIGDLDVLASDEQVQEVDDLLDMIFHGADKNSPRHRQRIADIDHLMAHKMNGRDMFVTNDKAILDRRAELARRFKITVMSSLEAVAAASKLIAKHPAPRG